MRAIRIHEQAAGLGGLVVEDVPEPRAAVGDVIVKVHAAAFTPGELGWPGTWTDRAGRDRTPTIPGHEVSGEVVEIGYGTTGLTVGQRVFGLTDWTRDGTLAEYVAVEARNLAPLPASIDHVRGAALPMGGLTSWQALFTHGGLEAGRTALIHGAGGGVGSVAVQLAHDTGARVIATGRSGDRDLALELGADTFADLEKDALDGLAADVVLDVIGGEVLDRSAALVAPGGTLVSIAAPPKVLPENGRGLVFVVEPDRAQLTDLAARVVNGRLRPVVGAVHSLEEAPAAFRSATRTQGKVIVQVV